jgi:hypothetical protein
LNPLVFFALFSATVVSQDLDVRAAVPGRLQPEFTADGANLLTVLISEAEGPFDWVLNYRAGPSDRDESMSEELPESIFEQATRLSATQVWLPVLGIRRFIEGDIDAAALTDRFSVIAKNNVPFLLFDWAHDSSAGIAAPALRRDGQQQVAVTKTDLTAANVSSKVALRDLDDPLDPGKRRTWETDETVNMPLAGPIFAYGQFGASTPWVDQQAPPKWQGKYGVGVKIKPGIVDEVQVRGGPSVKSDDTGRWVRGPSGERSEMFLEAVTKVGLPVVGPLNLQYTSTAVPPATAGDRNLFNQDFKVARPLAGGGQVHLGAKLRGDDASATASWVDRMQVYLGFELKR